MRGLVVYESVYGNTRRIAEAIAEGMAEHTQVELTDVVEADHAPQVDLLVVGGPTHVHGMTRESTRPGGHEPAEHRVSGLREWLAALAPPPPGATAVVFDTRLDHARWLTGSAALDAGRWLARAGYRLADSPDSFFVGGKEGPLLRGELERARRWGVSLGGVAERLASTTPPAPARP
jgi:hypothetical protein